MKKELIIGIIIAILVIGVQEYVTKEKPKVIYEETIAMNYERYIKKPNIKKEDPKPVIKKEETPKQESNKYRMTYYYTGDSTNSKDITASGKTTKSFKVNERGWYTYKGKLVVATASQRLLNWERYKNSKQKTYKLYDELTLIIEGKEYDAIVLDVCGACMESKKIDLFVKDKASGLDTQIKVYDK